MIVFVALAASMGCSQDSRPAPPGRAETRPAESRAATSRPVLSEDAKIERLLDAMAKATAGTKFIRNGAEHAPKAAADHLRSKWRSTSEIKSAKDFIDKIASVSSTSGKPYEVKLPDGTRTKLRDWLTERLSELQ
jgi:Family of unknown function (DUF5329)